MENAKKSLFDVMDAVPDGYNTVKAALVEGRIHYIHPNLFDRKGTVLAHLAALRGCDSWNLPNAARFRFKPSDRQEITKYMNGVIPGQTPNNSDVVRNVLVWLEEWNENQGVDL